MNSLKSNALENAGIEYFEDYNKRYDKGAFAGSEATKYNLDMIRNWIDIREEFSFTEECLEYSEDFDNWKEIDIVDGWHTKYGLGYIYVNEKEGTWRIKRTSDEFYGKHHKPFNFDEFRKSAEKSKEHIQEESER